MTLTTNACPRSVGLATPLALDPRLVLSQRYTGVRFVANRVAVGKDRATSRAGWRRHKVDEQMTILWRSIQKSRRLRKVSAKLGQPFSMSGLLGSLGKDGEQQKALDELFAIVENDPALRTIMKRHNVARSELDDLFFKLKAAGAGQWTRGHYVATSVFAFGPTLDYLLRHRSTGNWEGVAVRLMEYFANGEMGVITD